MSKTAKRFSDIAKDDIMLVGEKMKMENVIGKEIEIVAFCSDKFQIYQTMHQDSI